MTAPWSDRSALQALRPLEIAASLRARGWREAQVIPSKGSVWSAGANGNAFEIQLPLNHGLADYLTRLCQALETLALAEGRSPAQVWEDLTTSGADVVRAAVQRPDADDCFMNGRAGDRMMAAARQRHAGLSASHPERMPVAPAGHRARRFERGPRRSARFVPR